MIEALLGFLGIRKLGEIAKDMLKGQQVILKEYPKGAASELYGFPNVKIVEGEKPDEEWKEPYVIAEGPNGKLSLYGPLRGVLTYGFAEALLYISGAKKPKNFDPLPVPLKLRAYVYPGLPCYFVLQTLGELASVKNLEIEAVNVEGDQRLKMLYSLGVKSVPTFEVNGRYLHTGRLSAEELYELLKKEAAKELEKIWEELKKRKVMEEELKNNDESKSE